MPQSEAEADIAPRRNRRKTARPAEIVKAATTCFIEAGYGGTKLEDVARKAGIAKGTIYLYFDTKQDLFEAVIRAEVGEVIDDISAMMASYAGPTDKLLRMVILRAYETIVKSNARFIMRIIVGEAQQFPELRQLYYESSIKHGNAAMAKVLQRGVERGEFRAGAATAHPQLIMSPCLTAAIWSMTFADFDAIDMDSYIDGHIDLMLAGLRADSAAA
jgi:AcrR family transcriptional regulator